MMGFSFLHVDSQRDVAAIRLDERVAEGGEGAIGEHRAQRPASFVAKFFSTTFGADGWRTRLRRSADPPSRGPTIYRASRVKLGDERRYDPHGRSHDGDFGFDLGLGGMRVHLDVVALARGVAFFSEGPALNPRARETPDP